MIRLASGLVLAAAALAAIAFLPSPLLLFVALGVALLGAHEFIGIAAKTGLSVTPVAVYAFAAAAVWFVALPPRYELVLALALVVLLMEVLVHNRGLGGGAATVAGGLYVGVPLGMLVAVHQLAGRHGVLLLLGTIVASDSAQYYSGRMLGRHLLAPAISPKKTVEGAVGGLVVGTAVLAYAGTFVFPSAHPVTLGVLGLLIVVLGVCGDLFESRLKRAADLKDSSSLIPGHGGVLDRIDALLFATPAFYLFVRGLV